MITLKDLKKTYRGRFCTRFEYDIDLGDGNILTANFVKQEYPGAKENEWNMQLVIPRTRDKDSEVYNFGYAMPRSNLPLELIAASGIKYLQLYIKEEVQAKSNMDFVLGEILKGM